MRPRTHLFLALALLLSPVTARADKAANKPAPHVPTKAEVEALDSRQAQDYYRSNTEWSTWASSVAQACEPYKAFFGAGFPCTIDEPAAEAFYWNEVKTKSPDMWNTNNPGWACDSSSMVNVTTPFEVCKDSKKCTEEFKSRIKAVECKLELGDVGPRVTLEGSKLVFRVGYPSKGDRPGENGYWWWINRDLLALFPAYKAQCKARNLRDDIF